MDNPFKSPTVLSLCPGFLGLERGVERAIGKLRVAAYVEIEAFIVANLVAGMEAGILAPAPVWTNVKTFNGKPFHGKIHGILGGYPCQPFSTAGRRGGKDDPRHLWPYIRTIISDVRPYWCFFENVSGHLTLGYEQVKTELEALGYTIKEGIYSAAEVGAPHRRERLFILAVANPGHLRQGRCQHQSKEQPEKRPKELPSSAELANTASINGGLSESNKRDDGLEINRGSKTVADANGSRSWENRQPGQLWTSSSQQSPSNSRVTYQGENYQRQRDCWPSRPGEDQDFWEEPRTTEPGVGSTINGYNFREDLLRALGNSVVAQTAELAFRDLLKKHGL